VVKGKMTKSSVRSLLVKAIVEEGFAHLSSWYEYIRLPTNTNIDFYAKLTALLASDDYRIMFSFDTTLGYEWTGYLAADGEHEETKTLKTPSSYPFPVSTWAFHKEGTTWIWDTQYSQWSNLADQAAGRTTLPLINYIVFPFANKGALATVDWDVTNYGLEGIVDVMLYDDTTGTVIKESGWKTLKKGESWENKFDFTMVAANHYLWLMTYFYYIDRSYVSDGYGWRTRSPTAGTHLPAVGIGRVGGAAQL
jgi:hypothetical protein